MQIFLTLHVNYLFIDFIIIVGILCIDSNFYLI